MLLEFGCLVYLALLLDRQIRKHPRRRKPHRTYVVAARSEMFTNACLTVHNVVIISHRFFFYTRLSSTFLTNATECEKVPRLRVFLACFWCFFNLPSRNNHFTEL